MTGAHLRELMERMGHGSSKAAMGYLHSNALGALVERERQEATDDPDDDGDDPPLVGARR